MSIPAESDPLDEAWGQKEPGGDWSIDSLAAADWAARKIQQTRRRAETALMEFAEAIQEWVSARDAVMARRDRDVEFLTHHLRLFLQRRVEADPDADPAKPVTVELPCGGTLAYRPNPTGRPSVRIEDAEATLGWALENAPEAVSMVVDAKAVREAVLAGVEVPGTVTEPPKSEPWQVKIR